LIEHLAKKCHYRTEKRRQDDGWGDLDLGTPAASVAAATLPDEATVQAKRELEQQLQESEARSRDFQEQLECLKDGMSAGSEAMARVAELQKQLEAAEAAAADNEQRQAFQARIAELEQQLATKADVAPAAAADPLANLVDLASYPTPV
jgi:chromosome segregation ATPase